MGGVEQLVRGFNSGSGRRAELKETSFNVAVIGTGTDKSVGSHIADRLSREGLVRRLFVCDRSSRNADWLCSNLRRSGKCVKREYYRINSWLIEDSVDVAVLCAGNFLEGRDEELEYNARNVVGEVARDFAGYDGAVVVLTNPVDTIAYQFAVLSRCNPASVFGFSHIDAERGRIIIREKSAEKFGAPAKVENFFTIGAHNFVVRDGSPVYCMIPFLKAAVVNGMPVESVFPGIYSELMEQIPEYGLSQYSRKDGAVVMTASKMVANTFCDELFRSFGGAGRPLSLSVWLPEFRVYATWPARISGLTAVPEKIELGSRESADFERVLKDILRPNIEKLRSMGFDGAPEAVRYDSGDRRADLSAVMADVERRIRFSGILSDNEAKAANSFYRRKLAFSSGGKEADVPGYMYNQVVVAPKESILRKRISLVLMGVLGAFLGFSAYYLFNKPSSSYESYAGRSPRAVANAFVDSGYFVEYEGDKNRAEDAFRGARSSIDSVVSSLQDKLSADFFSGKPCPEVAVAVNAHKYKLDKVYYFFGGRKYFAFAESSSFHLLEEVVFDGASLLVDSNEVVLSPIGSSEVLRIRRVAESSLCSKAENAVRFLGY